jgi:hypothetical protein
VVFQVIPTKTVDGKDFQGSMLWSQISAISANFRRKIGDFLKNQCYDDFFENVNRNLSKKRQYFHQIIWQKIF